jgi:hypothetical protein
VPRGPPGLCPSGTQANPRNVVKPRIFISHSAKEPYAAQIRDALGTALNESGKYAVLLDQFALEPGDAWRSRINLWVGGCDAAVVLLSESALSSAYVAYETSILAYRRTTDPNFVILPVYLQGIDEKRLLSSRLSPQNLTEVQAIQGEDAATIIDAVTRKLDELNCRRQEKTPVELRAEALARLLRGLDDGVVDDAAERIDLDLGPWEPEQNKRLKLAIQLLSVGPRAAMRCLLLLQDEFQHLNRLHAFQEIVDIIGSAWVDYRSVERIPRIARGKEGRRAISTNAFTPLIAEMYVTSARITAGDRPTSWHYAECDAVTGEDPALELIPKVRRALAEALNCAEEMVASRARSVAEYGEQPIIIALHHPGIDKTVLDALRREFGTTTFFLLVGATTPVGSILSDAEVEWLLPELGEDDEQHFVRAREAFGGAFKLLDPPT